MCGIVGLYLKNPQLQSKLGALFAPMLLHMTQRGPDSAGFAVYRDEVPPDQIKAVLQHPDIKFDWEEVRVHLGNFAGEPSISVAHNHCLVVQQTTVEQFTGMLAAFSTEIDIVSIGRHIEIYKEVGLPDAVAQRFGLNAMTGSHAIGHTRMATESAVTTAGSHPFSTGNDVCLVHNGSLSNHNRLRRRLVEQGGTFKTDNDTEVAAQYFDIKLQRGASLESVLLNALTDLDGFYTFAIGTTDGFAVLRDPIACKPAVMAETDDWVGMASEFRALADLPDIGHANIWEPEPAVPYIWEGGTGACASSSAMDSAA
ncbi:MAG: glutamine amidotransferase family protein [Pseudomonadota bacterium]